jgi:SAM-dependent methyltransferase
MKKTYYLFPFEKIEKGSNIIIFGAGTIGWHYLQQITETGYCRCVAIIDNYVTENSVLFEELKTVEIRKPCEIHDLTFDYIIVAAKKNDEICAELSNLGVHNEKIVNVVHEIFLPSFILETTPNPQNTNAWDKYYDIAEKDAKDQFERFLRPILLRHKDINLENVMDFACGHGRIAQIFSEYSAKITCCDVNKTAIDFCKKRFVSTETGCAFDFALNSVRGFEVSPLDFADASFTFVYSWDAMVHFSYKWLDYYLSEFHRILREGAYVLLHHSNYGAVDDGKPKSEVYSENPHGRTPVTACDIVFMARKHGFAVCEQAIIDWSIPKLDCISLLKRV